MLIAYGKQCKGHCSKFGTYGDKLTDKKWKEYKDEKSKKMQKNYIKEKTLENTMTVRKPGIGAGIGRRHKEVREGREDGDRWGGTTINNRS